MIAPDDKVVVVGGGLVAARICPALRRKGLTGPIELIAAEQHLPYDRPPLSKDVLTGARDSTGLPFDPEALGVTVSTGRTATGLDTASRTVHTDAGPVRYDGLVIATGATPVRLPGDGEQLTLRTIDDALALRARLVPGSRVVIIGASWIGAEVATAARAADCAVTCVETAPAPLAATFGTDIAGLLLPWWDGIDLRCTATVSQITKAGVALGDGSVLPADVVVTGIGVRPAVSWLDGSGVRTDRGVLTDDRCRTDIPDVVALGDVAQRWSPRAGAHLMIEHWDDAGGAAATTAAALLSDDVPSFDPVPYFWSDQFGHKVQYVGRHRPDDVATVETADDGTLATARWTDAGGLLTAWLGVDRPRELVPARMNVGKPADHALA